MIAHATLVAAWRHGRWCGVLLRGPSGSGKSELALRAVASGWRLAADDRVRLWRSGGALYGAAPPNLAGLLEVRGLGVLAGPRLAFAPVVLVLDACAPQEVERIPDPARVELCGAALPWARLPFTDPAAVARLDRALDAALRWTL